MKQVTIENVKARISKLQSLGNAEYSLGLTLNEEFELACLRQLLAGMEQKPYGYAELYDFPRTTATLYPEQDRYATMPLYAAPPAPVSVPDADPSFSAMMSALNAFYADDDVPERAMLAAFRILLADVRNQVHQEPATDNTAQQFEALATSAQREPVAEVKHYTGNEYPTLKFAQNEWCVCGDREDAQELADAINALATRAGSGKSEHMLNAERIAREAQALSDRMSATSAVHHRVSGWSERQQKVITYSLWRFIHAAYQKANQAAQTNNKDMFDRFIRDARCAEEIREEFTNAWVGKL